MKSDLNHLLAFSFLGTQLTFWSFVLPFVVVNTLLTYRLLMVLVVVGSQLMFWPFFPAASSGSVHLRFPSMIELSICVIYVNCSSDFFVISSNLAFWVWCIFSSFSKRSSKLLLCDVTATSSASLCPPGYSFSFFTYLINLRDKIEVTKKFLFTKSGCSKLIMCPSSKEITLSHIVYSPQQSCKM